MKNKIIVSILSISFNQEKYIRKTLDGFVQQKTNFEYEVIIGDDCSVDDTSKIIQEYADKYPKIFKPILRKKNIGIQNNLIDILDKARGKYIAICEGDDYWTDSNKLQIQVDFLEKHPDYSLCFHPVNVEYDDKKNNYTFPQAENRKEFTLKRLLRNNYIQTNSVMYRRQKYKNIPNSILPLDWYLHLYHAQFGKIGFLDETMSVYRRHPDGIWWDSAGNIDEIWKKYSIEHTRLFTELLKLFGDDPALREIIYINIGQVLTKLIRIDAEQNTKLLHKELNTLSEYTELFLKAQHELVQSINNDNNRQSIKIINMTETLRLKEVELAETKNELRLIQSSRVWTARNKLKSSLEKLTTRPKTKDEK